MSRGLNKVMLIGNLGADPEIRYTAAGAPVANVSLATAESWRDKESGELRENRMASSGIFGKVAETIEKYVTKGSQIFIEGKLQTRKWQDKDGKDRYTTEIVASEMRMLGKRGESVAPNDQVRATEVKESNGHQKLKMTLLNLSMMIFLFNAKGQT